MDPEEDKATLLRLWDTGTLTDGALLGRLYLWLCTEGSDASVCEKIRARMLLDRNGPSFVRRVDAYLCQGHVNCENGPRFR